MSQRIEIKESDLHSHTRARMLQRGISLMEIEETLNVGWEADDAVEGTVGKVAVFGFNAEWEGKFFEEKRLRPILHNFIANVFCKKSSIIPTPVGLKLSPSGFNLRNRDGRNGNGMLIKAFVKSEENAGISEYRN